MKMISSGLEFPITEKCPSTSTSPALVHTGVRTVSMPLILLVLSHPEAGVSNMLLVPSASEAIFSGLKASFSLTRK